MIQKALEWLAALHTKMRPPVLKLDDGSGRILRYSDTTREYYEIDRFVARQRSVSNVESFAAMVIEEARRKASKGDFMTVIFSVNGATLHLDDRDGRTVFGYTRELDSQWKLLINSRDQAYEHREFVHLLRRLRPSLVEYDRTLLQFRKVSFGKGVKIESEPVLQDGRSGLQYDIHVLVNSKATEAALPSSINVRLPYARGGAKKYDLELDVAIELNEEKALEFSIAAADLETVADEAVADEVVWFRTAVAQALPELCILEDY